MRQLVITLALVLSGFNASAFQDPETVQAAENLVSNMQQDSREDRLSRLESFKEFLYTRLNTIEIPDLNTTSDFDPRIEEYRSLTEFDNYVNLITMRQVTSKACVSTKMHIENSTSPEGGVVPEAVEALKILSALCN